jgi:L-threonylcarbamoyladenylate synthase
LLGAPGAAGLESTVVDCTAAGRLHVLRAGVTTLEALRDALPDVPITAPASSMENDGAARSPGTRHRHYAPDARVRVVDAPAEAPADRRAAYIGLQPPAGRFALTRVCPDMHAYARALFAFFREADTDGCDVIYAQRVEETGLGRALADRLRRASAGTAPGA